MDNDNYQLSIINYQLSINQLVETKQVTKTSGNYWSVSENSSANAWNYNAGNGNWNNNNKVNSNYVRPVFAFRKITILFHEAAPHHHGSGLNLPLQFLFGLWAVVLQPSPPLALNPGTELRYLT